MSVLQPEVSKTEAEWQAEYDAETLARAEVIKNDDARLDRAQIAAGRIAEKEREEANAMSKVAGSKRKPPSSGGKRTSGTGAGTINNSHNVFQKI